MNIESLITLGYYISSIGFLIATVITALAAGKFGKSALGSVFSYLCIGTGVFFIITIFQKLGSDFFMIADESMDVWWHFMFYIALLSFFFGFKALVGLASGDEMGHGALGAEKKWGIIALVLLVIIFVIPGMAEPTVQAYLASPVAVFGLHHFLAFLIAAIVGSYLIGIKKNIGQIGRAVATPMLVAIGALAAQHFWELLTESWQVIQISSENIEGVEKIFLTITAVCITIAALRLKAFASPASSSGTPSAL